MAARNVRRRRMEGSRDEISGNQTDAANVNNPFANLLHQSPPPPPLTKSGSPTCPTFAAEQQLTTPQMAQLNVIIDVFRVTPYRSGQVSAPSSDIVDHNGAQRRTIKVVHLADLSSAEPGILLTQLDELLFERLMLPLDQLEKSMIDVDVYSPNHRFQAAPTEPRQLFYLYQSFFRLHELEKCGIAPETAQSIKMAIAQQASSYLMTSPIYPCSKPRESGLILELLDEYTNEYAHSEVLMKFLELVAASLAARQEDDNCNLLELMDVGYYRDLNARFENISLISPQLFTNFLNVIRVVNSGK